MDKEYTINLNDIRRVIKKRMKIIVIISLLTMIGGCTLGLTPSRKNIETRVAILVDKPISKEEVDKGDYDYLRFINAKNIMGPTELAKSQKIMKKVTESVNLEYDLSQANKIFIVTNNLDANMIYINIKGTDVKKVNKMLDVYTEEFLNEARAMYITTKFNVLDKEYVEMVDQSIIVKCSMLSMLGIMLGLIASVGLSIILEMVDKSIKKEEELETLGLKVLTVIPNNKEK